MADIFDELASQSSPTAAAPAGDIFDQLAPTQTQGDVFDQAAAAPSSPGVYNRIQELTGIPSDILSEYVKGLTLEYADAVPAPADAGMVRKTVGKAAHLAGMGTGLLPVGWGVRAAVAPALAARLGTGLAARIAAGAATEGITGGIYGAARDTNPGETRMGNIASDTAMFGAFGAGGNLLRDVAKLGPLTSSLAMGGAAGALEPSDSIGQKMENIALGTGTFGLAHGMGVGIGKGAEAVRNKILGEAAQIPNTAPEVDATGKSDLAQAVRDRIIAEQTGQKMPPVVDPTINTTDQPRMDYLKEEDFPQLSKDELALPAAEEAWRNATPANRKQLAAEVDAIKKRIANVLPNKIAGEIFAANMEGQKIAGQGGEPKTLTPRAETVSGTPRVSWDTTNYSEAEIRKWVLERSRGFAGKEEVSIRSWLRKNWGNRISSADNFKNFVEQEIQRKGGWDLNNHSEAEVYKWYVEHSKEQGVMAGDNRTGAQPGEAVSRNLQSRYEEQQLREANQRRVAARRAGPIPIPESRAPKTYDEETRARIMQQQIRRQPVIGGGQDQIDESYMQGAPKSQTSDNPPDRTVSGLNPEVKGYPRDNTKKGLNFAGLEAWKKRDQAKRLAEASKPSDQADMASAIESQNRQGEPSKPLSQDELVPGSGRRPPVETLAPGGTEENAPVAATSDPTFLRQFAGLYRLADKYGGPFSKIAWTMLDHVSTYTHNTLQNNNKVRNMFDMLAKHAPGGWDVKQKVFFGNPVTRNKWISENYDAMVEGKVEIPAGLRPYVKNITDLVDHYGDLYRASLRKRITGELTKINENGKEIPDTVGIDTVKKIMEEGLKEPPIGMDQKEFDRLNDIALDLNAVSQWGKKRGTHSPAPWLGSFKIMDANTGGVVAEGATVRAARRDFIKNKPKIRPGRFIVTTTLHQYLAIRGAVDPKMKQFSPMDQGAIASINDMMAMSNKYEASKDIREAGIVFDEHIARGIQDLQASLGADSHNYHFVPDTSIKDGKFFGGLFTKKTDLRSSIDDPMTRHLKYFNAMDKKFAVDSLVELVGPQIQDLKAQQYMPGGLKILEDKLADIRGRYPWEDRELDIVRNRFADFIDAKFGQPYKLTDIIRGEAFPATRALGKLQAFTATMTLGYSPVKVVLNRYGGVMRTIVKTSMADYTAGREWLKNDAAQEIIRQNAHLIGLDTGFTDIEGNVKADKWWKPLGMFQIAEKANRKEAFAAAYVKSMRENPGADVNSWAQDAVRSAQITQGIYNLLARPNLIRGPLLGTAFQFKQFMVNEQRMLMTLTPKEWAKYIPLVLASSGTRGAIITAKSFLFLAGMGALLDDINERLNKAAPRLHRGIPGLMNMDWSAAATWQLPGSTKELIGKPAADIGTMIKYFTTNMDDREKSDAYRQIFPVAYGIHKGLEILSTGQIHKGSRLQQNIPPGQQLPEGVGNLLGARSARESAESDSTQALMTSAKERRDARDIMMDRIVGAKNGMQIGAILQEMAQKNLINQNEAAAIRQAYTNRNLPMLMQQLKKSPIELQLQYLNGR